MARDEVTGKFTRGRLLTGMSILVGVCLIGAGIERILGSDYRGSMDWFGMFLAPGEIFLGTVLLFVPLYWRLSRDSDADSTRN